MGVTVLVFVVELQKVSTNLQRLEDAGKPASKFTSKFWP